jgi:hypothetical protein
VYTVRYRISEIVSRGKQKMKYSIKCMLYSAA